MLTHLKFCAGVAALLFRALPWSAGAAEPAAAPPQPAVLVRSFSVEAFGGDTVQLADLRGDGVKYYALVRDLDHDGLDEVLVYDRSRVWIFHAPP
jgi:hypothetical protein